MDALPPEILAVGVAESGRPGDQCRKRYVEKEKVKIPEYLDWLQTVSGLDWLHSVCARTDGLPGVLNYLTPLTPVQLAKRLKDSDSSARAKVAEALDNMGEAGTKF